ncbi:MAG: enoyl-CoA hydratase/isomerase family protein [Myxococcota bacterium]
MTYSHLHLERHLDGKLVELRFEHGKANEVSSSVLRELEQLAQELETDPHVGALITRSERISRSGTPIFISGADVTERVGWDDSRIKEHVRWQRAVLGRLGDAPVFHIVVVSGVAFGWGTEYLLAGDYAIATDKAVFALPETGLGILPGAGGTTELQARVGPSHALRLGMTGERISAQEALRIGLVQEHRAEPADGLERARALAALAAKRSPTALKAFKSALYRSRGHDRDRRREIEATAYEACVDAGEAAIGRKHFAASRRGEPIPWGPKTS